MKGLDPQPPGLHVITEARILMNTPSLGRSQLLSAVRGTLRAQCTQLLLHVSTLLPSSSVYSCFAEGQF